MWSLRNGLRPGPLLRSRKVLEDERETGFFNETFKISTLFIPPYFGLKNASTMGQELKGNDRYEGYAVGKKVFHKSNKIQAITLLLATRLD